ncbi:hypothetical protein SAMN02745751_01145 [Dethiosulfatibacter aminovorans DSM 17477]|uniref:Uncharacterized protein n=1 Tax=Dethiosulfatibacter aminovorans DSM 17477 TaxID=1121476 RepID=A0A1M6EC82_9FIRM|nr:hypothetical protein SAMN02745751_01145 [Dethiosulfatibacter aminovorans DSM 17477]
MSQTLILIRHSPFFLFNLKINKVLVFLNNYTIFGFCAENVNNPIIPF